MLRMILGVILVGSAGWIILLALLTLFLGMFFLRDSFPPREKKLVFKTESGELRITQAAIEDLIKGSTEGIGGLKRLRAKFKQSAEGLTIDLTCQVEESFDFTKVSQKIQETVKKTIEQYSEIKVKEVRVLIQPVTVGSRPALRK